MAEVHPIPTNPRFHNLTDQKFGRLDIKSYAGIDKSGRTSWNCLCECGNSVIVQGKKLKNGHTRSCGCLSRETITKVKYKHGLCETATYRSWNSLKKRCRSKTNAAYSNYGGRGIKVCERWMDFSNFLADMGERPSSKHSIDRIDNNGNYSCGKCE